MDKNAAVQPAKEIRLNVQNPQDREQLMELLKHGAPQIQHVESSAFMTNSVLLAVLGNEALKDAFAKESPKNLKKLFDLAVERAALENENLRAVNATVSAQAEDIQALTEATRNDISLARRGQGWGVVFMLAALLSGIFALYKGDSTAGVSIIGMAVASPLINNFIASKWGSSEQKVPPKK